MSDMDQRGKSNLFVAVYFYRLENPYPHRTMNAERAQKFIDNLWELSKGIETYYDLLRLIDKDRLDGLREMEYKESESRKVYRKYRQVLQLIFEAFPGNQCKDLLEDLWKDDLDVDLIRHRTIKLLQDIYQGRIVPSDRTMKCTEKIVGGGNEAMNMSGQDLQEPEKRSCVGTFPEKDDESEARELQAELALLGLGSRSSIAHRPRSQTPVERREDKPQVPRYLPGLRELPDQRKEQEDRELEAGREAIGLGKERRAAYYEYRSSSEIRPPSPSKLDGTRILFKTIVPIPSSHP